MNTTIEQPTAAPATSPSTNTPDADRRWSVFHRGLGYGPFSLDVAEAVCQQLRSADAILAPAAGGAG